MVSFLQPNCRPGHWQSGVPDVFLGPGLQSKTLSFDGPPHFRASTLQDAYPLRPEKDSSPCSRNSSSPVGQSKIHLCRSAVCRHTRNLQVPSLPSCRTNNMPLCAGCISSMLTVGGRLFHGSGHTVPPCIPTTDEPSLRFAQPQMRDESSHHAPTSWHTSGSLFGCPSACFDLMLAPQGAHGLRRGTKETIARQAAVIWEWKCRDSVSLDVCRASNTSDGYSQTDMLLCMPSCAGWSSPCVRSKVTPPLPSQIDLLSAHLPGLRFAR